MKDTEALMRELCAASSRLQEAHYIAKKAGQHELAREIWKAGEVIASSIGKLITKQIAPVSP
jgi:hypothetical protein